MFHYLPLYSAGSMIAVFLPTESLDYVVEPIKSRDVGRKPTKGCFNNRL